MGGGVKKPLGFISHLAMVCALFFDVSAFGYTVETDTWIKSCLSGLNCCDNIDTAFCGDTGSPSETTPGFTWSTRTEALEEGGYACKCNKELYCLPGYYLECAIHVVITQACARYKCAKCPEIYWDGTKWPVTPSADNNRLGVTSCYVPAGTLTGNSGGGNWENTECTYVE